MLTASRKLVSLFVLKSVEPYRSLFVGSVELRSSVHYLSMRIGIGSALLLAYTSVSLNEVQSVLRD